MAFTRLLNRIGFKKGSPGQPEQFRSAEEAESPEGGGASGGLSKELVKKAESEAARAESARLAGEVSVLFNVQNLEKPADDRAANKYYDKGSLEAVQFNVAAAKEKLNGLMNEVEADYQAGRISERDMSVVQKAMREAYEAAKYPLGKHTFRTSGHNAVIQNLTGFMESKLDSLQQTARDRISLRNLLTEQDPGIPPEARINLPANLIQARNRNGQAQDYGTYIRERSIGENEFRAATGDGVGPAEALNGRFVPQRRDIYGAGPGGQEMVVAQIQNFEVELPGGEKQQRARRVDFGPDGNPTAINLAEPLGA